MITAGARCTTTFSILAASGKRVCLLLLVLSIAGCMGWVPGRKAYWDEQVEQLCAKDGGVTVYETVLLTQEEYRRLDGTPNVLPIPSRETALARGYPYFMRTVSTRIRESNPEVARVDVELVRVADNKVLGRSVGFFRRGGDFRTGLAHDSSFSCPEPVDLARVVFNVTSSPK